MITQFTYVLAYFIETLICIFYFSNVWKYKKCFPVVCCVYFLSFIIQLSIAFIVHIPVLNNISFLLCIYLISFYCYDTNIFSRVFHCILLTILMNFSELVAIGTLSLTVHGFNPNEMVFPITLIYLIISKLSMYIFVILCCHFLSKKQMLLYQNISFYILLLVPILSDIVSLSLAGMCSSWALDNHTSAFIFTTLLCLIILNIVFVFTFYYMQNRHAEYLDLQLQLQLQADAQNYSNLLTQQNEQQRILIHDIKNHLHTIQLLAKDTLNAEKIENYINELDIHTAPVISGNRDLDLILNRYNTICKEKDIPFHIEVYNADIHFLTLPEITSLFCNLLDNALDAVTKSENPFIHLRISDKNEVSLTVINLVNACISAPKIDHNGFLISSKKNAEEHGFGLRSVQKIIHAHNGTLNTYFDENDQTFHTIITLEHKRGN